MSCSRCKGCMIEDYLIDMEESFGPMWQQAWRCMNCGHVVDSVFEQNRRAHGIQAPPFHSAETTVPLGAEALTRLAA